MDTEVPAMLREVVITAASDALIRHLRRHDRELGFVVHPRSLPIDGNPDLVLIAADDEAAALAGVRLIRETSTAPVIALLSDATPEGLAWMLDAGAADALSVPFSLQELRARVAAAVRRRLAHGEIRYVHGLVEIDFVLRKVTVGKKPVHLTPLEYEFLALLAGHAGQVLTHDQLIESLWGGTYVESRQALHQLVKRVRTKLVEPGGSRVELIRTEPWVGYAVPVARVSPTAARSSA